MVDLDGIEEIEAAIDEFARGNPMHFETMVAEGVWFDFDCPFVDDLMEPLIPCCVGFHDWSPHNEGEPEERLLMDYADGLGDEIVADLGVAAYNAGCRFDELVFEYSLNNSGDGTYVFLGSIPNPRVVVTMDGVEVVEEYA